MIFKELPREDLLKLLEGQENILGKEVSRLQTDAERCLCPFCSAAKPILFVDAKRPYKDGSALPNFLARCRACGAEFALFSGLALTVPRPGTVG